MEVYFRELIRGVDSSLLEEWERLRNPGYIAAEQADKPARPAAHDITRNVLDFRRLVRTAIFGFLQDVAAGDWENAAARINDPETETGPAAARRIEAGFTAYGTARTRFRLDPEGRATQHTHWTEDAAAGEWRVAQMLIDPAEHNDWEVRFTVALAKSRSENRVMLRFNDVQPLAGTNSFL